MNEIPDFLIQKLEMQYGKELAQNITIGYQYKRPVTLRINTLKISVQQIKEILTQLQIPYHEVAWCKEALILQNVRENTIRELDIYKNGEIYLQSLSSMLPPIILKPKPNVDILDMAAAPGGKTSQLAAITNNQAHITACEVNKIRLQRLKYNIQKQGATSVYIMEKDARQLDDYFSFNQILLDAPCSGAGTLYVKNPKLQEVFTR
ncbi:MAG: RsmB/NOP family class I SAM-dependent RNA methyltransferase [Clostridia bacterium]|nr:RsmB/NOP family class I SAM-dependent RNA methyltransferase [Clostridia bacterium]